MIITLTSNVEGHQRLYLGGTSSIELWLEKANDGRHWTIHCADGLGGNHLSADDKRHAVKHRLWDLSHLVGCEPDDLQHVPWGVLVALHDGNPRENRRMAMPRRSMAEYSYVATPPNMHRPKADFTAEHFAGFRAHADRNRHHR